MQYRADIDGLRAIAILPVLLYHAGVPLVTGGYVGVDIFFVISGFLITRLLMSDIAAGTFSIATFYERRIRRIMPALLTVLAATFTLGYMVSMPGDLADIGRSAVATTLFYSNFHFWLTSGYFEAPHSAMPLLHTWSLAVEEQFYILFPLLLLAIARYARGWFLTVLIPLALGSLALSIAAVHYGVAGGFAASGAFYLLPTRAWELLLGALLAIGATRPLISPRLNDGAAAIGALLIIVPIFTFTAQTPFPGINALYPCIGAALLLYSAPNGMYANRILSYPAMVFTGKISYSLYLWHWPLIVFATYANGGALSAWQTILIIAATVGLSVFTWRFVEQPCRHTGFLQRRTVFTLAGVAATLCIAIGLTFTVTNGLPQRLPETVRAVAAYADYNTAPVFRSGQCFLENDSDTLQNFDQRGCLGMSPDKLNVLVLGDSHAAHLWYGLFNTLPNLNILQATASGCRPLLDIDPLKAKTRCREMMGFMLGQWLPATPVDAVILAARWVDADTEALKKTIAFLRTRARAVYVVGPTAEYTMAVPSLLARGMLQGDPNLVRRSLKPDSATRDDDLRKAVAGTGAIYLSAYQALCPPPSGVCSATTSTGMPLQFDYGHLTAEGSTHVATMWKAQGAFNPPPTR
jgi:peptidoglycan/LPS O-acetylase OafA/YrhL